METYERIGPNQVEVTRTIREIILLDGLERMILEQDGQAGSLRSRVDDPSTYQAIADYAKQNDQEELVRVSAERDRLLSLWEQVTGKVYPER